MLNQLSVVVVAAITAAAVESITVFLRPAKAKRAGHSLRGGLDLLARQPVADATMTCANYSCFLCRYGVVGIQFVSTRLFQV